MTLRLHRTSPSAIAGAALLSLVLVSGTAAQVATLSEPESGPDATPAPAAVELDGEEALLEFAQCMRDNGIEMADPQFGSGGGRFGFGPGGGGDEAFDPQSSEFQGAMETCDGYLTALAPDIDASEQAERAEQQLLIADCMRDLGYDFPDPATGGGFGAQLRFLEDAGIDPTDPTFQSDISSCQSEAGFEFGPPGGGGSVAE